MKKKKFGLRRGLPVYCVSSVVFFYNLSLDSFLHPTLKRLATQYLLCFLVVL